MGKQTYKTYFLSKNGCEMVIFFIKKKYIMAVSTTMNAHLLVKKRRLIYLWPKKIIVTYQINGTNCSRQFYNKIQQIRAQT